MKMISVWYIGVFLCVSAKGTSHLILPITFTKLMTLQFGLLLFLFHTCFRICQLLANVSINYHEIFLSIMLKHIWWINVHIQYKFTLFGMAYFVRSYYFVCDVRWNAGDRWYITYNCSSIIQEPGSPENISKSSCIWFCNKLQVSPC